MTKTLHKICSFVRRGGRITPAQKKAFDESWLTYGVTLSEIPLDLPSLFQTAAPKKWIVEIGFGMGHSLLTMAEQFPEYNFLGVEVYQPGIGAVLNAIQKKGLKNIRVVCEDATEVVSQLSKQTLDGILIFFPDPWPKKRHHKRRLVQLNFVEELIQKLKIGGYLHIATDWQAYADHMKSVLLQVSSLQAVSEAERLAQKILPRSSTKFERRGEKLGHQISEFVYRKIR